MHARNMGNTVQHRVVSMRHFKDAATQEAREMKQQRHKMHAPAAGSAPGRKHACSTHQFPGSIYPTAIMPPSPANAAALAYHALPAPGTRTDPCTCSTALDLGHT